MCVKANRVGAVLLQGPDVLAEQKIRDPAIDDVRDALQTIESPFGLLTLTQPPERMSITPQFWARLPVAIGMDAPRWT